MIIRNISAVPSKILLQIGHFFLVNLQVFDLEACHLLLTGFLGYALTEWPWDPLVKAMKATSIPGPCCRPWST